eukprot:CAMPEP_0181489176 /NCGR_PEP_ID=MMETSP1110-20121109/48818_1 /TAXON_ID=174948 /ORGANISM="Symbiodinium sp., Strain CCMP421" /LENGTH=451 /DNA_ID=CAMNT_0023615943 /DNA_START=72 /DNA_END=1427 /DNA_ORIENTATION=+
MQLAAYSRHTFSLGHAAMLVNETMPDSVVEQDEGISGVKAAPCKASNAVSWEWHSSQTVTFALTLLLSGSVVCSDAYGAHMAPESGDVAVSEEALLESSDAIFIGCPHTRYRSLPLQRHPLLFDCWGFARPPELQIAKAEAEAQKFLKVAVVGGAGHVGLPLSLALAQCGHVVTILDKDSKRLESIKAGKFPFLEAGGAALLQHCLDRCSDRLLFSTSVSAIRECDVVVVTIGTPVEEEHLNPCFPVIQDCVNELKPFLRNGQTLLLRSTVFPGTSSRVLADLPLGVGVSFCPERIAQGKAVEELRSLPQLISGSDQRALVHAQALFSPLKVDLITLELQEAEAAKLFLNAWRYVAFGTAKQQFYHIATSKGLDFEKLRAAIVHRYPRGKDFPRPGFTAGPCLFKDTMQLAAYCRHTFSLGHSAMLVNETMPDCVVEYAKRDLDERKRSLQ